MSPLFLKLSSKQKRLILTAKLLVNIKTQTFYSCLILTENFLVSIKTQKFYSCLILTKVSQVFNIIESLVILFYICSNGSIIRKISFEDFIAMDLIESLCDYKQWFYHYTILSTRIGTQVIVKADKFCVLFSILKKSLLNLLMLLFYRNSCQRNRWHRSS